MNESMREIQSMPKKDGERRNNYFQMPKIDWIFFFWWWHGMAWHGSG
jgi:hypothetical protein